MALLYPMKRKKDLSRCSQLPVE